MAIGIFDSGVGGLTVLKEVNFVEFLWHWIVAIFLSEDVKK